MTVLPEYKNSTLSVVKGWLKVLLANVGCIKHAAIRYTASGDVEYVFVCKGIKALKVK